MWINDNLCRNSMQISTKQIEIATKFKTTLQIIIVVIQLGEFHAEFIRANHTDWRGIHNQLRILQRVQKNRHNVAALAHFDDLSSEITLGKHHNDGPVFFESINILVPRVSVVIERLLISRSQSFGRLP